jgi:glycerol uptake facilitator-like aquaporin
MSKAMAADDGADGQFGGAEARPRAEPADLSRIFAAEAAGSGLLAFFVVAAGILGERYAIHNVGLALLITALTGAAAFFVLSRTLGAIAPTFFNPALALAFALAGRTHLTTALLCAAAQIAAAFLGVMTAHLVTNTGLVQVATQIQTGEGVWLSEALGTALFVLAMLFIAEKSLGRASATGALALLVIALATPSTSFANPALTLARALTDSFTAIRLEDALAILAMQLIAGVAAWLTFIWFRAPANKS